MCSWALSNMAPSFLWAALPWVGEQHANMHCTHLNTWILKKAMLLCMRGTVSLQVYLSCKHASRSVTMSGATGIMFSKVSIAFGMQGLLLWGRGVSDCRGSPDAHCVLSIVINSLPVTLDTRFVRQTITECQICNWADLCRWPRQCLLKECKKNRSEKISYSNY